MLGHWLIWQGQPLAAARPYFDAAVAAGRDSSDGANAAARGRAQSKR
jgi:hypothetical protein